MKFSSSGAKDFLFFFFKNFTIEHRQ